MPGRLRALLSLLLLLCAFASPAHALGGLEGPTATEAAALADATHDHTAYTLPPDKLAKAQALHRMDEILSISGVLWTPLQLLILLFTGVAAWMSTFTDRLVRPAWLRTAIFVLLLLLAHTLLSLPIRAYAHHVGLVYGLSVQRWPSWFSDQAKGFAITWVVGSLAAMTLFSFLRASPRRWWLGVWPIAILFVVAGVLLTPYVIDPLFNHFEPLSQSDPTLVTQLERVVQKSGIAIPPERMFLMNASQKSTGMNAYVTGFGPSKRIVVWDTTVAHSTQDDIAFVFAHELGHYALGHVVAGMLLSSIGLLPIFWLAHHLTGAALQRWCSTWNIRHVPGHPLISPAEHAPILPTEYPPASGAWWTGDRAALVVLLLMFSVLSSISDPIGNAVSRRMEHNADVYGQEAVRGIVGNPQVVGVRTFQELGELSLDDPTPHPFFEAWFGTHPPIWLRAAFIRAYDPWEAGAAPKYFAR